MTVRVDMLRAYLRQSLDGPISQVGLSGFVQPGRTLVTALTRLRTSTAILCASHEISLTDLAYDCRADSFGGDYNGSLVYLETFVSALHQPSQGYYGIWRSSQKNETKIYPQIARDRVSKD